MALREIVASVNAGYLQVVDVDLQSYFDTIDHELLMRLVEQRVGDVQILRLIRAWLKAGVMEEGKVMWSLDSQTQAAGARLPCRSH